MNEAKQHFNILLGCNSQSEADLEWVNTDYVCEIIGSLELFFEIKGYSLTLHAYMLLVLCMWPLDRDYFRILINRD